MEPRMSGLRYVALCFVAVLASSSIVESSERFIMDLGIEFDRGLTESAGDGSHGLSLDVAYGGFISPKLWLGVALGGGVGDEGEWIDIPVDLRVYGSARWWFAGRERRFFLPVRFGVGRFEVQYGYDQRSVWITGLLVATGVGFSVSDRWVLEGRVSRVFDLDTPGARDSRKSLGAYSLCVGFLF
ncbi:MAG: hypothetical protein V2I67_09425 [Thermoanaerobaculales bacterium]|jgi:hypothetical protein|nr:hypothetical protein [Thermoanaerobaculales bacterium]